MAFSYKTAIVRATGPVETHNEITRVILDMAATGWDFVQAIPVQASSTDSGLRVFTLVFRR